MKTQDIKYSDIGLSQPDVCHMSVASGYNDIDAAYNWVNVEFPTLHSHTHWELFVIVSGEIEQTINGTRRLLSTGDACLIKPEDTHCFLYPDGERQRSYQHFNITVSIPYAEDVLRGYLGDRELTLNSDNRYFDVDGHTLRNILDKSVIAQSYSKEKYELTAKYLFNILLAKYFEKRLFSTGTPPWLSKFLIDLNEPEYFTHSLKSLAEKTGYSYSHLNELFKSYIGKSISDYRVEIKTDYAKNRLAATELSVLEIAAELGYSSVSSFNHIFKKNVGVSPLKFRLSEKEKRNKMPPPR